MTDSTTDEAAPRARNEGDAPGPPAEDEHWEGYPGGERATSYPVVDRGRNRLLLFLLALAFAGTAVATATRQSENLPRDERGLRTR